MKQLHNRYTTGYIAISTVLVIMVVVLVIGISVSLLSVSDIQMSLSARKSDSSLSLTESCIENSLLELNETGSITSPVTTPNGICTVVINSQSGQNWIFTTTATQETYTTQIQVTAQRTNVVTITSWQEL